MKNDQKFYCITLQVREVQEHRFISKISKPIWKWWGGTKDKPTCNAVLFKIFLPLTEAPLCSSNKTCGKFPLAEALHRRSASDKVTAILGSEKRQVTGGHNRAVMNWGMCSVKWSDWKERGGRERGGGWERLLPWHDLLQLAYPCLLNRFIEIGCLTWGKECITSCQMFCYNAKVISHFMSNKQNLISIVIFVHIYVPYFKYTTVYLT